MSTPQSPNNQNLGTMGSRFSRVNPEAPGAIGWKHKVSQDAYRIVAEYDDEEVLGAQSPDEEEMVHRVSVTGEDFSGKQVIAPVTPPKPIISEPTDITIEPQMLPFMEGPSFVKKEEKSTKKIPSVSGLGVSADGEPILTASKISGPTTGPTQSGVFVMNATPPVSAPKVESLTESREGSGEQIIVRVILLRHLVRKPFDDKRKERRYEYLMNTYREQGASEMDSEELSELNALDEECDIKSFSENSAEMQQLYDDIFSGKNGDVEIWYDNSGKKRNGKTVETILTRYGNIQTRGDISMPGSDKGICYVRRNSKNLQETVAIWDEIEDVARKHSSEKPKILVLIGNRAYAEHFLKMKEQREIGTGNVESERMFESSGYFIMDVGQKGKKIIPIQYTPETLVLDPAQASLVLRELGNLSPEIKTQIESSSFSLEQIQNMIHEYMRDLKSTEVIAFSRTLLAAESVTIRAFAIGNLLKHKAYDVVFEMLEKQSEKLSHKEKEVLIQALTKRKDDKAFLDKFARLYVGKHELWDQKLDEKIFEEHTQTSLYEELNSRREAFMLANNLQRNSLDINIQNDESIDSSSLIARGVAEVRKSHSGKVDIHRLESDTALINRILKGENFVLPAMLGQGKSMWLTKMAKKTALQAHGKNVHFFEAKDPKFREFFISGNATKNDVIFVDAIDEIADPSERKLTKKWIETQMRKGVTFVLTSRPSEYWSPEGMSDTYGGNPLYTTLRLEAIDRDAYFSGRVDDPTRELIFSKLDQPGWKQEKIGENPLILCLIMRLATWDPKSDSMEINEDFGIKKLQDIHNVADLYENIIKLILAHHPVTKGENITTEDVRQYTDILEEHAFNIFDKGNTNISRSPSYCQRISLLCKRHDSERSFTFVHQSFYEYFLAKHLAKARNGDETINKKCEDLRGNKEELDKFSQTILFYAMILVNENRFEDLVKFLSKTSGYISAFIFRSFSGDMLQKLAKNKVIRAYFEKLLAEPKADKSWLQDLMDTPIWKVVFSKEQQ